MNKLAGHYAPWLLNGVLGLLMVITVAPQILRLVRWRMEMLIGLAVFAAAAYLAAMLFAHGRRLCEHCIEALPLDASTVAEHNQARFHTAHLFERRQLAVGYLAVVIASSLLYDHAIGRYVWAAVQGSLGYLLLVYVTHQRLQPWCPECPRGGGSVTAPTAPVAGSG